MENYILPVVDDLSFRPSGEWVKGKLFYLENYIRVFGKSMKSKPWRRRIFIDLFAGPGKCQIRETNEIQLGSPLLALTAEYPFSDYYFVDLDPENVNALRSRSKATKIHQDRIHVREGDANEEVKEIVKEIKGFDWEYIENVWPCLNLAFLDPEGLELHWETVRLLAQLNRMDLIIHYSQNGITRNADKCFRSNDENEIDRFFGDDGWRRVYASALGKKESIGIHRPLIDYYKSKLRSLGYVEIRDEEEIWTEPLIRNAKRNAPLYRLLFASKNPLGVKFWKEVTKVNVNGQIQLM